MAFSACDCRVHAGQRKADQVMVETGCQKPARLRMTLTAVLAELAGMRIVNGMTRPTGLRDIAHRRVFVA